MEIPSSFLHTAPAPECARKLPPPKPQTPEVDELSLSSTLLNESLITSKEGLPNDIYHTSASLLLGLSFLSPLPTEGIHLRILLTANNVQQNPKDSFTPHKGRGEVGGILALVCVVKLLVLSE